MFLKIVCMYSKQSHHPRPLGKLSSLFSTISLNVYLTFLLLCPITYNIVWVGRLAKLVLAFCKQFVPITGMHLWLSLFLTFSEI